MSEHEQQLMKEHGGFLDALLADGTIIAHGPVMDPAGGYGVSLFKIDDDATIVSFTDQDPFVKADCGHYEHYEMLHIHH